MRIDGEWIIVQYLVRSLSCSKKPPDKHCQDKLKNESILLGRCGDAYSSAISVYLRKVLVVGTDNLNCTKFRTWISMLSTWNTVYNLFISLSRIYTQRRHQDMRNLNGNYFRSRVCIGRNIAKLLHRWCAKLFVFSSRVNKKYKEKVLVFLYFNIYTYLTFALSFGWKWYSIESC